MVTKHNRKTAASEFGFFQVIIWIVQWVGIGIFIGVLILIVSHLDKIGV